MRTSLRARHRIPGIVLRVIGAIEPPKFRAPLRLAAPDTPEHLDVQPDLSPAEEMARQLTNIREIDESQKAVTERLRDRCFY